MKKRNLTALVIILTISTSGVSSGSVMAGVGGAEIEAHLGRLIATLASVPPKPENPQAKDPTCQKKVQPDDFQPKWGPKQTEYEAPVYVKFTDKAGKTRYAKVFYVQIPLGEDPKTGEERTHRYSQGIEVEHNPKRKYVNIGKPKPNKGFPCQYKAKVQGNAVVTTFLTIKDKTPAK